MKLASVMNYENSSKRKPFFLKESMYIEDAEETPCKVSYNSSWDEGRDSFDKVFSFHSRDSLKSFAVYILDFEIEFGTQFDINIKSKSNEVNVTVSSYHLGSNVKSILAKIDAMYSDVIESYKIYE